MSFKYLICLDFEATCWSYDWKDNAEIIGTFSNTSLLKKKHHIIVD